MELTALVWKTFLVAGLVAAAPPSSPAARQASTTQLTFTGAGVSFAITANVNGQTFFIRESYLPLYIPYVGRSARRNKKKGKKDREIYLSCVCVEKRERERYI